MRTAHDSHFCADEAEKQSGPVYKITISRPDIDLREHGAKIINARMGLNTWAAFAGTEPDFVL